MFKITLYNSVGKSCDLVAWKTCRVAPDALVGFKSYTIKDKPVIVVATFDGLTDKPWEAYIIASHDDTLHGQSVRCTNRKDCLIAYNKLCADIDKLIEVAIDG